MIVPFIILYTIFFATIATFAAFCVLEAIQPSEPKKKKITTKNVSNSTLEMKRKMKEFKKNYVPKLNLDGMHFAILMVTVSVICFFCVYILSCICSLYDKLKVSVKEQKTLPLLGNMFYGAVRESESSDS